MLFGGFSVFVILVLVLAQLGGGSESSSPSESATGSTPQSATNEQIISRHLAEAGELLDQGRAEEAIREHLDVILLIDPDHGEALGPQGARFGTDPHRP